MCFSITHDNTLGAAGAAALLHEACQESMPAYPVFIMTCSLPYSLAQHHCLMAAIHDVNRRVIVLEDCPSAPPTYSMLRIKHDRVFYVSARLSLRDYQWVMRFIAHDIAQRPLHLPEGRYTRTVSFRPDARRGVVAREWRATAISPSERSMLDLLLQGLNGRNIAHQRRCSNRTISAHKRSVMNKLGAHSAAELHFKLCVEYTLQRYRPSRYTHMTHSVMPRRGTPHQWLHHDTFPLNAYVRRDAQIKAMWQRDVAFLVQYAA